MKLRILFVDDEPNILQGLQRMLRSMKEQWDMEFAPGGKEALAHFAQCAFDVVVSDVRMPGMNGVELLAQIREQYPKSVRILLSGQSSVETIMSAIGPAHQFLSKPCEADLLKTTIERACHLGHLLEDDRLKQIVSRLGSMPTCPSLYLKLQEELEKPEASVETISRIIAQDVGMTANILKLVNSAFFGVQQHISDPAQATLFLGVNTLKTLVLGFQVFEQMGAQVCRGFTHDRLFEHSLLTAEYARKIVQAEGGNQRMEVEAFTAGILHDVGILLFASQLPEQYQEVLHDAAAKDISLEEAEQQTLGTSHAELGAYLLGLWGIVNPIVEAVAFHHKPANSLERSFCPLTAVHIANILADKSGSGASVENRFSRIDQEYLTQLGLANRYPVWTEMVMKPVKA